jgi:ribosomal protein S18 acetylase RimI-like enzyme
MTAGPPATLGDVVVESGIHRGEVRYEPFDSELLGLVVGRTLAPADLRRRELERLLQTLADRAGEAGFDQLIRRVAASSFDEIWALESAGYLLMDVGVTFVRRLDRAFPPQAATQVDVRAATPGDVEHLLETMLDVPWGSRYEADPAYDRVAVRSLQARWLRNSLAGRADHVLVGHIEGQPAGYVTCRLVEEHGDRIGEIDLVGTVPAFRGRGVAAAIIDRSLAWFSERVELVTVRTQATNTAAAGVYERAGMTLRHSDMTFRLALTERGGKQ